MTLGAIRFAARKCSGSFPRQLCAPGKELNVSMPASPPVRRGRRGHPLPGVPEHPELTCLCRAGCQCPESRPGCFLTGDPQDSSTSRYAPHLALRTEMGTSREGRESGNLPDPEARITSLCHLGLLPPTVAIMGVEPLGLALSVSLLGLGRGLAGSRAM